MQIKTTMRYHLTPVRMTIINILTCKYCQGCGEKGNLLYCWWEYRLVQSLWKTVWSFLKKLKMKLTFDPSIPLLGTYPETPTWKNISPPMFITALFTIANLWKQPKWPSADEWIKSLWYIYTMEYYVLVKKKELLPFVIAWMIPESIKLSDINQSEYKYNMISLICGL